MAPSSVVSALRLYASGLGGTPAGNELALFREVRSRFNANYADIKEIESLTTVYLYAVEPIVRYVEDSLTAAVWAQTDAVSQALHVFECYSRIIARTRIGKRFTPVTEQAGPWGQVEQAIKAMKRGVPLQQPRLAAAVPASAPVASATLVAVSPWYLSKPFLVAALWLLAWLIFQFRTLFVLGRYKFYLALISTLFVVLGVNYIFFGNWNIVVHRRVAPEEPDEASLDDGVSETSGRSSNPASPAEGPASSLNEASQSPLAPSAPPPVEVQKLSDEVEGLKVLIQKILEASPSKERRAPEPVLPTPAPPAAAPATANAAMEALMSFGLAASMPHSRSRTFSIILIGVITLPYEDAFHVVLPPGEVGVGRCGLAGPPHSVRPGAVYAGVA